MLPLTLLLSVYAYTRHVHTRVIGLTCTQPMCLNDVRAKLLTRVPRDMLGKGTLASMPHENEYTDAEAFAADVNLIFENCRRYNGRQNPVFAKSQRLKQMFVVRMKKMLGIDVEALSLVRHGMAPAEHSGQIVTKDRQLSTPIDGISTAACISPPPMATITLSSGRTTSRPQRFVSFEEDEKVDLEIPLLGYLPPDDRAPHCDLKGLKFTCTCKKSAAKCCCIKLRKGAGAKLKRTVIAMDKLSDNPGQQTVLGSKPKKPRTLNISMQSITSAADTMVPLWPQPGRVAGAIAALPIPPHHEARQPVHIPPPLQAALPPSAFAANLTCMHEPAPAPIDFESIGIARPVHSDDSFCQSLGIIACDKAVGKAYDMNAMDDTEGTEESMLMPPDLCSELALDPDVTDLFDLMPHFESSGHFCREDSAAANRRIESIADADGAGSPAALAVL